MKIVLYILLLNFSGLLAFSQKINVIGNKSLEFATGVPSPINIEVEGYSSRLVILTTNNGEIVIDTLRNEKSIVPSFVGPVEISVSVKTSNGIKRIGKTNFEAIKWPDPIIYLGGYKKGDISRKWFRTAIGLTAGPAAFGWECDCRFPIDSFKVLVIRNENVIFTKENIGKQFDPEIEKVFQSIRINDIVMFKDIICRMPDKIKRVLQAEYKIKD